MFLVMIRYSQIWQIKDPHWAEDVQFLPYIYMQLFAYILKQDIKYDLKKLCLYT